MLLKADGATVSDAELASLLNLFLLSCTAVSLKHLFWQPQMCVRYFPSFLLPTKGLYGSKLIPNRSRGRDP